MPTLTVNQPPDRLNVQLNQPILVTGHASDVGPPEPHLIDSVTIQVDGGTPVRAPLTRIPDKHLSIVTFKAWVEVTGGADPHIVTVTATNDNEISVSKTVNVFVGVTFEIDAPAVLIEMAPFLGDPAQDPKVKKQLRDFASQIQQQVVPLSTQLSSIGEVLAGPNLLVATNPAGIPVLRIGLWIEDPTFPVTPPNPPDFPLPVVPDPGAIGGFALLPFLKLPDPSGFSPAFGISAPVASLQKLLDVAGPQLTAAASQQGASIDSFSVHASSPGSVTVSVSGSLTLDIPFSFSVTEFLGTKPSDVDPNQMVPAVIGTTHSASAGSLLDWLVDYLVFGLGGVFAFLKLTSDAGDDAAGQVNGIVAPLIAGLPSRIPVHNTELPEGLPGIPDFPLIVLNWTAFGATSSAILGAGTTSIEARDESVVAVAITGPTHIRGYQSDLSGGAGQVYQFSLTNIVPDPNGFTFQIAGAGSGHGSIGTTAFAQTGSFSVRLPLPFKVKPGTYPFTLAVNVTETCGTDPAKRLTAAASIAIVVEVLHDPRQPF